MGSRKKTASNDRRRMFRFNQARDLSLVTSVEALQPFLATGDDANLIWTRISDEINGLYNGHTDHLTVRNRFKLLLAEFKKEDFHNRYKTGTEEEITAIKDKLSNISSLIDDAKLEKDAQNEAKAKKTEDDKAIAEELRSAALKTVKRKSSDPEIITPKRSNDKNLAEMWNEKQLQDQKNAEEARLLEEKRHLSEIEQREKDRELRLREFELKEKELQFEKEKMEHKKLIEMEQLKLQRDRFEIEKQERSAFLETQKTMLELLKKQN